MSKSTSKSEWPDAQLARKGPSRHGIKRCILLQSIFCVSHCPAKVPCRDVAWRRAPTCSWREPVAEGIKVFVCPESDCPCWAGRYPAALIEQFLEQHAQHVQNGDPEEPEERELAEFLEERKDLWQSPSL